MDRDPDIARLVRNDWIRVAILDPDSPAIQIYRNGGLHAYQPRADKLPRAASSVDWYRGWRDHLEFAAIGEWDFGADIPVCQRLAGRNVCPTGQLGTLCSIMR